MNEPILEQVKGPKPSQELVPADLTLGAATTFARRPGPLLREKCISVNGVGFGGQVTA